MKVRPDCKEDLYFCICGHLKKDHDLVAEYMRLCWGDVNRKCPCRNFKLDNLSYIEQLAKQKGLI
jgi:hypothetical protein